MLSGKKVIYISTICEEETIYKRFIIRTSWDYYENGIYDYNIRRIRDNSIEEKYNTSYQKFKENCIDTKNLYIVDCKKNKYLNLEILTNIFKSAYEKMGHVDIVIIDDIDNMILRQDTKLITNKSQVFGMILPSLLYNADNFIGTSEKVNIIIISCISDLAYEKSFNNSGNLGIKSVDETIRRFADEIIYIR